MELRHLRYFVALAEELHFARAARKLGIAQPPLSRQIAQLECEVGARLFDRDTRKVQLTEAGSVFLTEARLTLAQAERALRSVRHFGTDRRTVFNIGYGVSFDLHLLPLVISRLMQAHPEARINARHMLSVEQPEALLKGDIDVGLVCFPLPNDPDPRLVELPMFREPIIAVLPADHPLAQRETIPLSELATIPYVGFERSLAPKIFDYLMDYARAHGVQLSPGCHASSRDGVFGLVREVRGFALMTRDNSRLPRPGICFRHLAPPYPTMVLGVIHNRNDDHPLLPDFIAHVKEIGPNFIEPV